MMLFWGLSLVLIASAVWVVTARKPVYSVVGLLAHFAALAAMYLSLNAEFLAAMQIIVYSGAILILFLFVIALLSSGITPFSLGPDRLPKIAVPAGIVGLACIGFLVYGVARATVAGPAAGTTLGVTGEAGVFGSVADFGKALFTVQLLPFEVTALILMVAVIGVVMLAGEATPYVATRKQATEVRREMREAIVRGGDR